MYNGFNIRRVNTEAECINSGKNLVAPVIKLPYDFSLFFIRPDLGVKSNSA